MFGKFVACCSVGLAALALGCGPGSVSDACELVVVPQCEKCFACGVDGAEACGLPSGSDETACVDVLQERCVDQAATLERPKRELETCEESLPDLECEAIVRASTQSSPHTTDACEYFL